jgi:hypothetical protein
MIMMQNRTIYISSVPAKWDHAMTCGATMIWTDEFLDIMFTNIEIQTDNERVQVCKNTEQWQKI